MAQSARTAIIFSAAGSGGHAFAAIATIKAFQSAYPTLAKDVVFVGSNLAMEHEKHQMSMEERLCLRLNIPFRKIRMGKFQRRLSLTTVKLFFKIIQGFWDSWRLLTALSPKVIVAFGSYVSFPLVVVGKLRGIKVIIHEQSSSIGLTNKVLLPFANVVAVAFESSLPYVRKDALVVGSPTMFHIYGIKTFEHLEAYLKKEKSRLLEEPDYLEQLKNLEKLKGKTPIILMSGGSQGSHFLNDRMRELLPELLKDTMVILQVGENEYFNDFATIKEYLETLPKELSQHCLIRRFVYEEYGYLMHIADLFVGRSGANTVYQVGMNGTPAIFVPIPWVTRNEQYTNAMVLQEKGQATIIEEKICTPERLLAEIRKKLSATFGHDSVRTANFPLDADLRLAKEIARLAV